MVRSLERFVSCIALVGVALVETPGRAPAQDQPTELHFTTAITQVYGSDTPLRGASTYRFSQAGTCAATITRRTTNSSSRSSVGEMAITSGSI